MVIVYDIIYKIYKYMVKRKVYIVEYLF